MANSDDDDDSISTGNPAADGLLNSLKDFTTKSVMTKPIFDAWDKIRSKADEFTDRGQMIKQMNQKSAEDRAKGVHDAFVASKTAPTKVPLTDTKTLGAGTKGMSKAAPGRRRIGKSQ